MLIKLNCFCTYLYITHRKLVIVLCMCPKIKCNNLDFFCHKILSGIHKGQGIVWPNIFIQLKSMFNLIEGSLVNFICEAKSVSKQDVLIMVTCPSKVVQ